MFRRCEDREERGSKERGNINDISCVTQMAYGQRTSFIEIILLLLLLLL